MGQPVPCERDRPLDRSLDRVHVPYLRSLVESRCCAAALVLVLDAAVRHATRSTTSATEAFYDARAVRVQNGVSYPVCARL
jgi:hypothetical protein